MEGPGDREKHGRIERIYQMPFFETEIFTFVVLPVLIFLARICDVTIGTARIIFVARGYRFLAPLMGFFEVLIWLITIGRVMQNLDNVYCYIAYAGGFAAGNFVGISIEKRIALGMLMIRVITKDDASALAEDLRASGYGVTSVPAEGKTGRVNLLLSIIRRSDLEDVLKRLEEFNPAAFYTVEDVRQSSEPILPMRKGGWEFASLRGTRKSK